MNEEIWNIPYSLVKNDWDLLQRYLEFKGNPKYIIVGNVNLRGKKDISDLGNLVGIEGNLWLQYSSIESLGELKEVGGDLVLNGCKKITTLGKVKRVDGDLSLGWSSIEYLGDLQFVGIDLRIYDINLPQSEINNVEVIGKIRR